MAITRIDLIKGKVVLGSETEQLYVLSPESNIIRISGTLNEITIVEGLLGSIGNDTIKIDLDIIADWYIEGNAQSVPGSTALKWAKLISTYFAGVYPLQVDEWLGRVAKGLVPGHRLWQCLGERESIQITVSGEDMTRMNELTPTPTSHTLVPTPSEAGESMTLVCESADDDIIGTGIQKVTIEYLRVGGIEGTEVVDTNGITGVVLGDTDIIFINDMYTNKTGSSKAAVDMIKIHKTGSIGLVYNMIAQGGNKSLVPHRMIPINHIGIIHTWSSSEGNNKRAAFRLRSTDMRGILLPGVFCFKDIMYLNQTPSPERKVHVVMPALSIAKISVWATAVNPEGSCSFTLEVIDNNYL